MEVDRSAGEHDQGECCASGVESESASYDEPDPVVEALDAAVGETESDGGEDPVAVRQGHIWATAFHPELTPDRRLHAAFVEDARAWALPLPTESGEPGGVRVRA